ncbi:hypothetical protein JCM10207_002875 [Rhodosporidiobolus poonsookiae]
MLAASLLLLSAFVSTSVATPIPSGLFARQAPSVFCNPATISAPNVTGLSVLEGQQVVAVAIARGTQNYTCMFSQQIESGTLAFLYDVTCLASSLSASNGTASPSSTTSSTFSSETASSTSVTGSVTTQADSTSAPAASTGEPSAVLQFPLDDPSLQPPSSDAQGAPPTSRLGNFTLSNLPALVLNIPFPFNGTTFPYADPAAPSTLVGETFFAPSTLNSTDNSTQVLPSWVLPGYGTVTAQETSRVAASTNSTAVFGGGSGANGTSLPNVAWASYEVVNGGQGMFASTVWRTNTAGGGLQATNCTVEGNTTVVDFAALYYFFR